MVGLMTKKELKNTFQPLGLPALRLLTRLQKQHENHDSEKNAPRSEKDEPDAERERIEARLREIAILKQWLGSGFGKSRH